MEEAVKELKVDFRIEDESGVRKAFEQFYKELGFSKILVSRTQFPDYILKDKEEKRVLAEAEFRAAEARHHGEELAEGCDLIICWYNDWPDRPKNIGILELSNYIFQPLAFSGFEKEGLSGIPKFVRKYDETTQKAKQLLKDIEGFVKRRDHQSSFGSIAFRSRLYEASDVPLAYYQSYRRQSWKSFAPVSIALNFDYGNVCIQAEIWAEDLQKMDTKRWRDIIDKVEEEKFSLERQLYGTTNLEKVENMDRFFTELGEPNKIARVAFSKKYDFDILYGEPSELVEKLGNDILWMLSFLEQEGIYTPQPTNE